MKHISSAYFVVKQHEEDGDIHVVRVDSASNLADGLTKPQEPLAYLRFIDGVIHIAPHPSKM